MIHELAGHVWWQSTGDASEDYDVFLQTDRAVYRCSSSEGAWREVSIPPSPRSFVFSAPLERTVLRCLSGNDRCHYILFSDGTAVRAFSPPSLPALVKICGSAATFLDQDEVFQLLEANRDMRETPVIRA